MSVFPGDETYNASYMLFDSSYDDVKPAFVAFPESVEDVQRCLQCSAANAAPCVVKSGGHSNAGYSTIDGSIHNGFMISLAKLNRVRVSGDTVVAQTGAWWGDVYAIVKDEALITGGSCSSVGVGGYTLGGGRSVLSRKYGLAIDNVVSMTMVTVNGDRVVVANATTNPDLFWALRGGGGGNFGIVTDITFKAIQPYDSYTTISINFESNSKEALETLGSINKQLPRELSLHFMVAPGKVLNVTAIVFGSRAMAVAAMKPLMDMSNDVQVDTYSSYSAYLSTVTSPASGHYERGCFLSKIDKDFSDIIFSQVLYDNCGIVFDHLGGAIAEVSSDEMGYFHRSAQFECDISCIAPTDKTIEFQDNLHSTLEEAGYCLGSFLNVMDRRLAHWQEKYYGDNYPRLLEIKNKWNPIDKGYFHFPQEIGSDYHYSE